MDIVILTIGSLAALSLAIAGLFRPFLGLLVFLAIHFVQPGELIPALAPFRIELVYGAVLMFILLRKAISEGHFSLRSDPILFSVLPLIGAGLVSAPLSVWPLGTAATVVEMVKLVTVTFMLKLLIDSETRLRSLLWCLAGVTAWFAGSSLSGYFHGEFYALKYDWGTLDRAQGINSVVGGPNELAGLLLALLPLLIALLRCTRNAFARILLIGIGGVSLAALSLTGSRIAIIGLIAVGVYYSFQSKHKLLTCTAALIIAGIIWSSLAPEYRQRYLTVESYAQGGELDASNELRLEVWKAGWQIFSYRPLVGIGAGQFANAYGEIYLAGKSGNWMNPHNLVIQVACELGLVGLVAFGYFLWQIAKGIAFTLRKAREDISGLSYQVGIACSVMFLGTIILSLVSHTLYRPHWYLLAGLVAANRHIIAAGIRARAKHTTAAGSGESVPTWGKIQPAFAMARGESPEREISRPPFQGVHAALRSWCTGNEQNTSARLSRVHTQPAYTHDEVNSFGSEVIFPAAYWNSGTDKDGDQG